MVEDVQARRLMLGVSLMFAVMVALAGCHHAPSPAGIFTPTVAAHAVAGTSGVFEEVFQARMGPTAFDRLGLHRISRAPAGKPHAALTLLYLPGTNMNGTIAVADPRYSLPLYLAAQGVDVWTLDYRTHFIPPITPRSELSELKDWNNELFASDIATAAGFIRATTDTHKIFIAGFSRGVTFAYLVAARQPETLAGLIALDGWIPDRPTTTPNLAGGYADDIGGAHLTYQKREALLELVIRDPDAPAPLPAYKTAAANLAAVVYGAAAFGGHGGLANPLAGYSDPVILARVLRAYDRYWPAIQDSENPFTPALRARLAASKIPVIAFASTNLPGDWVGRVTASASATGSADVTVKVLPHWGHLDVIHGTHAASEVFAPILAWLRRHRG